MPLMVLAGYGGMVSLAQLTVAGIAGYGVAICGANSVGIMGSGWPWWIAAPFAILLAAFAASLIGLISVRTSGIYTIMITLAMAKAFYYFVNQNYSLFNGFSGFRGIQPSSRVELKTAHRPAWWGPSGISAWRTDPASASSFCRCRIGNGGSITASWKRRCR